MRDFNPVPTPDPTRHSAVLARQIQRKLAGRGLTPAIAKLYGQHTHVAAGQRGLSSWSPAEANDRLDDAVRLIEAALLNRDAGDKDWDSGMRRAGEILEWLVHPEFNLGNVPVSMLGAVAYQIAGFPAMAASLLDRTSSTQQESAILRALLKSDFPTLLVELVAFWSRVELRPFISWAEESSTDGSIGHVDLEAWIIQDIVSSIGVLCAHARWGDDERFERALDKLASLSGLFLHGGDAYGWLLSRLTSEMANSLQLVLLRTYLAPLTIGITKEGKLAFELYARNSYLTRRATVWPSQILGLKRLRTVESFTLCTPTGSGKTTVAEVAVLQSLFTDYSNVGEEGTPISPLAMYLVPSKALAAEAESRLSKVLHRVSSAENPITVTGLYGGTDWGPTDAWLTREGKTVLICTYEKAEALIRFLGPLFLNRLRLVVVDEAHAVGFNGAVTELVSGENRALRLESLGTRLLSYVAGKNVRIVALSAVASGMNTALASWIHGENGSTPVSCDYRSTRQLIGRLECLKNHTFEIKYDLLNGSSLQFSERGTSETPFITSPFPPCPPAPTFETGPERRLRPYLLWSAIHLAALGPSGHSSAVLMFASQNIGAYAKDFLTLLEEDWDHLSKPRFFEPPKDPDKVLLWSRCLDSCADYFTKESSEYRLLGKGVVVHHGKMPRLLSRLLVESIEDRITNLVIATSTLSEGVNLPFEILLVPTLRRRNRYLSSREFSNLSGRTGRPGVATEGRSLVLLPPADDKSRNMWKAYQNIIVGLQALTESDQNPLSPLAELLRHLQALWEQLPKSGMSFERWLEQANPQVVTGSEEAVQGPVYECLDALDSILLSIVVEAETIDALQITPIELEARLTQIWQRTYAHYASTAEAQLSDIFVRRGKSLIQIYPDQDYRRQLYKTSLPPTQGKRLITLCPAVRTILMSGAGYSGWQRSERFRFVRDIVAIIRTHPKFKEDDKVGRGKNSASWEGVLEWWLNPPECPHSPEPEKVADWYDFVYANFDYRFNWGLSGTISIMFDESVTDKRKPLALEDWPSTGLPWIAFWIKELIVWGTLEPVAAFFMSRRNAWTRHEAEALAKEYYSQMAGIDTNELLNPSRVRDWTLKKFEQAKRRPSGPIPGKYAAKLLRDFSHVKQTKWRVVPSVTDDGMLWLDIAGFRLAKSDRPVNWNPSYLHSHDFTLFSDQHAVIAEPYV